MSEIVPIIYAPPIRPVRITLYSRLIALAIAVGCAAIIGTAMTLHPSPDGLGTHEEMGFLACTMYRETGIPCPSCGMTTSFTWFYHADLLASLWVQPGGFVLAWLTGMLLFYALYEAVTGRPVHRLLSFLPGRTLVLLLAGVLAFAWGWKIMIHLAGIDGWRSALGG